MPRLNTHRKRVDKVELGSMDKRITIYARNISPINDSANPNFEEIFTNPREVWASVESSKDITMFDSMGMERVITDKFYLRYQPDYPITSENWVKFNSVYYKIMTVSDLQEYKTFLLLETTMIGDISKAASAS